MPFDLETDDVAQRRLQRLEHRYCRAQNALAGTRAAYASLREMPGADDLPSAHPSGAIPAVRASAYSFRGSSLACAPLPTPGSRTIRSGRLALCQLPKHGNSAQ
jgi:hypothetical protein